jgi:hypothetical protein
MCRTVLLARRDVIRKQDEALTHLQKRNALGGVARLFGGICAGVCLVQVLASRAHFSVSAMFIARNAERKGPFPDSALPERKSE